MLVSVPARAIGMESATTPHISALRKTPLNALHRRLRAKMVNVGGWDMPVESASSGGWISQQKARTPTGWGGVYTTTAPTRPRPPDNRHAHRPADLPITY